MVVTADKMELRMVRKTHGLQETRELRDQQAAF